MKKDMLIDNTNDKVASEEEKAIWKILDDYGLNPMLQPNCGDEIIALVNKLFIQRVSQQRELLIDFMVHLFEWEHGDIEEETRIVNDYLSKKSINYG